MFPAARVADPLTHDMVTPCGLIAPPGVPTVLIEWMPAANVGTITICTGVIAAGIAHPPVPAPPFGTPIIMGCPTVLVGGMPLARWAPSGDSAACGVFLGNPAMMATRTVLVGS